MSLANSSSARRTALASVTSFRSASALVFLEATVSASSSDAEGGALVAGSAGARAIICACSPGIDSVKSPLRIASASRSV